MVTRYNIHDIIAYNKQGVFSVGIIVKITIVGEVDVLYLLDNTVEIREDNISAYLGNALHIKETADADE